MTPRSRPRLGLRQRVSVAFGLGALAVSLVLAVSTYTVAANFLWAQRETTVVRQATFNARVVNSALSTRQPAIEEILDRIDGAGQTSSPLVWWDGRWHDGHFAPGAEALPRELVTAAQGGEPVRQRFFLSRTPVVAIALPVEGGAYLEVFPVRELDQTLTTLSLTFAGTTTMTTLLGVLLGRWASRRALRPLTTVTAAANAIAEGDLSTRLGRQTDRDLGAIAEAFNRTAGKLQARVERDRRFAANVTHELRSPLTTMVNAVDLLCARRATMDPETQEILDLLAGDVHRLAGMVEDLLEISLVDNDAGRLRLEEVPLTTVVRNTADRVARRPVTRSDGYDPRVSVDRRRLERVVENLVHNAETHGGGVAAVKVLPAQDAVRVVVEDHGPGVAEENRERVFERFARAAGSPAISAKGVGLGLSLVAEHVRLHGGRVWVEESPGHGARFVVELPAGPR